MSEIKFSEGIPERRDYFSRIIYPEELLDKKCGGCVRCELRDNRIKEKNSGYHCTKQDYDIDNVVKQLEEIRLNKTCNKEKCDAKELCRICVVDDAIEIVIGGGVDAIPKLDKSIEELELIRAKKTCNKEKCDTKEICRICVVDDAIEIVKRGGVQ